MGSSRIPPPPSPTEKQAPKKKSRTHLLTPYMIAKELHGGSCYIECVYSSLRAKAKQVKKSYFVSL